MSSQQAVEAILAVECGFDLSILVYTSSEESERDEDPFERNFSEMR